MTNRPEKPRILIVDDNYGNRLSLETLLAPDYTVDVAASGQKALALALQNEYAVILLDVRMPEMDGFETAALLKTNARTQDTAIIFTSAFDRNDAQVARGYTVGGADYLFSPVDPDFLKLKLRTYVRMHERLVSLRRDLEQVTALLLAMQSEVGADRPFSSRLYELERAVEHMRQDLSSAGSF